MNIFKLGFVIVLILALCLLFLNSSIPKEYLKAEEGAEDRVRAGALVPMELHGDRRTFVRGAERSIDDNEQRIALLRERIEEAGPKAILTFRRRVDRLDRRNGELKQQLQDGSRQHSADQERFRTAVRTGLDSIGRNLQVFLVMKMDPGMEL